MNDDNQAGWNSLQFGDVITYHNSGVYKSKELYGDQGENIIGISQLYSSLFVDGEVYKRVPLTLAEQKKHTLHENDLLYGESSLVRSGIARTVCVTSDGEGTAFAWHTRRLKIDQRKAYSPFLAYLLELDETRAKVESVATQTALTGITTKDYFGIPLRLPTLDCQRKVAKVLATVDNLIDQTQNLIDKYTAVKQGMMADLFSRGIDLSGTQENNKSYGQLRPSYENAPELYQETELGWVPKGWDVHPVENVSIGGFKNGYFKDPKLVGSGKKLINVTELYQDFGIDITTDKVERIIVSPKDFEKYKVDIGDLFFTRSSLVLEGIAKSNIVRNLPEEAVFECHVMRLKPNKEVVVPEFLALFTGMPKARSYLMSMAKQVTMTTIAQPDMVGLPTPVPSLNEQQAIVEKIDAIDELIRKEKETVEKNKNIKKGLMQDLLTGKVKV